MLPWLLVGGSEDDATTPVAAEPVRSTLRAVVPEGQETDLGDGIYAQRQGPQVAVILPERLWARTDDKLTNSLQVVLPKVYGVGFWDDVATAYNEPALEQRANGNVLRYNTRHGERVYVNPVKDTGKGVYAFSTWVEP
jgi:hypothetical protein